MRRSQFKRQLLATALAMGALSAAAPAFAQDQSGQASVEEVVVTGSRIPQRETQSLQPIIVTNAQKIEDSGLINLGNVIRENPLFQTYDQTTGDRASANQGDAGVTFANLYNLGSQRTLTLIDGKRVVGAASANGAGSNGLQVDISAIPTGLVDHVETISVGGAPVYGSDAIAGTVNVILKDHFTGLQVEGQAGETEHEDGFNGRFQVLWGSDFANGRGNAVLSGAYTRQDAITAADRDFQLPFGFVGSIANPQLNVPVIGGGFLLSSQYGRPSNFFGIAALDPTTGATFGLYTDAAGNPLTFDRSGKLAPFNPGTAAGAFIPGFGALVVNPTAEDRDTTRQTADVVSPSERYFLNGIAHYDLTDHIRANARFSYTRTNAQFQNFAPLVSALGATADTQPIVTSSSNPFLTPEDRVYFINHPSPFGDLIFLSRELTDVVGDGKTDIEQDNWNVQAGLQGDFSAFGRNWTWDFTLSKGETDRDSSSIGVMSREFGFASQAVYANGSSTAILPTPVDLNPSNFHYDAGSHTYVENGTGNIITCAIRVNTPAGLAGDPAVTGCAPFNPFGAQNPEDALNYLRANQTTRSVIKQEYAQGNISGDLFNLPAGALKFAAGFEIRKEQASFDLDALSASGGYLGGAKGNALPLSGFTTREVYSEVRAPLLTGEMLHTGLFQRLEFEGAIRYMSNTQAGSDLTWTAGGRLQFSPDLMVRGNKTRSVRQPSVAELFSGTQPAFQSITDPCAIGVIDTGPNPSSRRSNCEALVIASGLASNTAEADTFLAGYTTPLGGIPGSFSGNPNLESEKANSWTIGAVITPRFLPGFMATVDWVNINISGAITAIDGTGVADYCVDDSNGINNQYCAALTRAGPGAPTPFRITSYQSFYANVDRRELAGLTLAARYGFDLGGDLGSLTLDGSLFYLDHDREGQAGQLVDSAGSVGRERYRANAGVRYSRGPFSLYWQTLYYGPSKIDPNGGENVFLYNDVASYMIHDVSVRYDVTESAELQLTVNNVFDKDPPFNSFSYQFDRLGRRYNLGFKYKF